MEQEVSGAILVQDLDPVDGTFGDVDECHAGRALANNQRVHSDVVGADPERVDGLCGIEANGAVLILLDVQRELVFEHRGVWPERQVVRACRTGLGEWVQMEAAIDLRRVCWPRDTAVSRPTLLAGQHLVSYVDGPSH